MFERWTTKPGNFYEQLLASTSCQVSYRDFERLVVAFGFELRRTRGSHRHYAHSKVPLVLTINPDKASAHRYQVRLLLELVEEYGLNLEG